MSTNDAREEFLQVFATTILAESPLLERLVLSRPGPGAAADLQRLDARLARIKTGTVLSCVRHFQRRDETANLPLAEAPAALAAMLGQEFYFADLRTSQADYSLRIARKGKATLVCKARTAVAQDKALPMEHDRQRLRRVLPGEAWLRALGISDTEGRIIDRMRDKYRQIEKFCEIMEGIHGELLPVDDRPLRFVDMGAGKAYLTFALYGVLARHGPVCGLGVELRRDLVERAGEAATQVGWTPAVSGAAGLEFREGAIATSPLPEALDILVALHACDTATDDALLAGLRAGARAIVCSPCCHKQVRRDMAAPAPLSLLTRHGILEERLAEMVTDGVRALVLEAWGYQVKVFEFIGAEHTGKNLMLSAVYKPDLATSERREAKLAEAHTLLEHCGVQRHYLLEGLAGLPQV